MIQFRDGLDGWKVFADKSDLQNAKLLTAMTEAPPESQPRRSQKNSVTGEAANDNDEDYVFTVLKGIKFSSRCSVVRVAMKT